ncbi:TetR/AcrR family transcriptional repressor of lmrAB and yxaGH operons [Paenibacillus sp. W4I10]|uniref:TetR/AcrR family transcriptional regulator n=1 Tax=Paenibacillus sp. W4I10 TaxID=3042298 RepID=UPI00277E7F45|nr:TetR/AcrR family transcriptional regulator [Paenibacillus sp. W4I10]MDQ0720169.1 TetR/AcrR family transcriptional repressor of lmrAB and yxaGH operons [Paenibacillus sp. W4I10]
MTRTVFEKSDVIPLVTEVFRELGYEGATLSKITARTRLSKGSLYYFFPGGKEEMAAEILAHIDQWFIKNIFEPLEKNEARVAIDHMWQEVDTYFQSGQRICLIGAFALDETRDRFAAVIRQYFIRWIEALSAALVQTGISKETADQISEETIASIQGGLILSRALNDESYFERTLANLSQRVSTYVSKSNSGH